MPTTTAPESTTARLLADTDRVLAHVETANTDAAMSYAYRAVDTLRDYEARNAAHRALETVAKLADRIDAAGDALSADSDDLRDRADALARDLAAFVVRAVREGR